MNMFGSVFDVFISVDFTHVFSNESSLGTLAAVTGMYQIKIIPNTYLSHEFCDRFYFVCVKVYVKASPIHDPNVRKMPDREHLSRANNTMN